MMIGHFIRNTILISLPVLGFILVTIWQADGTSDTYYGKFIHPKSDGLVVGVSLANQGIIPSVLDSIIGTQNTFNFALALSSSAYGPLYYQGIKKKLNSLSTEGLFIVSVNPWNISSAKENVNDSTVFIELKGHFGKIKNVNTKPNFEYFLRSFSGRYLNLWFQRNRNYVVHRDGWMEITVPMDEKSLEKRKQNRIKEYRQKYAEDLAYSPLRFEYLEKIVHLFAQHGRVYLVRMPVCPEIFAIEQNYMPDFDSRLTELSTSVAVPYLNFMTDTTIKPDEIYQFLDCNHLWKESGRRFSVELAERIKEMDESR